MNMPPPDGFEVLDRLRKRPGMNRLPVAMFSDSDLEPIGLTN